MSDLVVVCFSCCGVVDPQQEKQPLGTKPSIAAFLRQEESPLAAETTTAGEAFFSRRREEEVETRL